MTPRERIQAVYRGDVPDQVPYMLDLSHWFYHRHQLPWDLSTSYQAPEVALIDYHKKMDVGFYLPNLGSFFEVTYANDIKARTEKSGDGQTITWHLETPLGRIQRTRTWEEASYSWGIGEWGITTEKQLKILGYALANRRYRFLPKKYRAWVDTIGDIGVCYVVFGYSGMGQLLSYWMGIEGSMFATIDWPETVGHVTEQINQNNLELADVLATSPVEFVCMGDNFSGDVQPPHFFDRWSRAFYTEAIRRLHEADKFVAVHIDGRLFGAIKMIQETGADCADAVTPPPLGDLTPEQCRDEAGPDFILSGGVSPDLWLPEVDVDVFKKAVLDWLELKKRSPRLIANAGDQVPPGAVEDRIHIMRDLVEEYGRY
ncbi:MAG: uroporphyrinogen decarboxylase family protein [Pirellulales bacterium]